MRHCANPSVVHGLYLVTPVEMPLARLANELEVLLETGVWAVQYRRKSFAAQREACALLEICQSRGVKFIINDDPHLARSIGADGVHLGKDDLELPQARAILGPERIIGISCYNELQRALNACAEGADYVAFGSFFVSKTKPEAVEASMELLRQAHTCITQPIVAIGGITSENVSSLIDCGVDSVAVSAGIFDAFNPPAAARRIISKFAGSPDNI